MSLEVLLNKPNPNADYKDMRMPSGLKETEKLLPHQMYALEWLSWRENSYPNGANLADDTEMAKFLQF